MSHFKCKSYQMIPSSKPFNGIHLCLEYNPKFLSWPPILNDPLLSLWLCHVFPSPSLSSNKHGLLLTVKSNPYALSLDKQKVCIFKVNHVIFWCTFALWNTQSTHPSPPMVTIFSFGCCENTWALLSHLLGWILSKSQEILSVARMGEKKGTLVPYWWEC